MLTTDCQNTKKKKEKQYIFCCQKANMDAEMESIRIPKNWTKEITKEGTLYKSGTGNTLRSCLIRNDMTIEVRAKGLLSKYPPLNKISQIKQIEQILKKINEARLCKGLEDGFECKNVLFHPPPLTNSLCVRCPLCQRRYVIERKRERRKQIRDEKMSETEKICVVKDCPGKNDLNIKMYKIPTWDLEAWCKNLQLKIADVNDKLRVCSRHFEESSKNPHTLKLGARPTLNLGHTGAVLPNKVQNYVHVCCIVGCNATNPPNKLFSFPNDEERLKQWLLICVIKDQMITNKKKYICRKHFDASMFGRKKSCLKKTAMPKMEAENWLQNNANKNIDVLETLSSIGVEENLTHVEPETQALNDLKKAIISNTNASPVDNIVETDSESDESDCLECLQCKNVCTSCAKTFKDCEAYHDGCCELEKLLHMERKKNEQLKIQYEQLLAALEENGLG